METGSVLDLYVPSSARSGITPHAIIALPRPGTMELLLCYDSQSILKFVDECFLLFFLYIDEGVYVNSTGGPIKDTRLQWGEIPSSIGMSVMMMS
jgi:hypothetical protein